MLFAFALFADRPIGRMFEKSCFPGVGKGRSDTILTNRTAHFNCVSPM